MKLPLNEPRQLTIIANEFYSTDFLEVSPGEVYDFSSPAKPKWKDLFIPATADGCWNPLLFKNQKRVPGERCFKLCGSYGNSNDDNIFVIGSNLPGYTVTQAGHIHFFANDHKDRERKWFYENNKGFILLNVTRRV